MMNESHHQLNFCFLHLRLDSVDDFADTKPIQEAAIDGLDVCVEDQSSTDTVLVECFNEHNSREEGQGRHL